MGEWSREKARASHGTAKVACLSFAILSEDSWDSCMHATSAILSCSDRSNPKRLVREIADSACPLGGENLLPDKSRLLTEPVKIDSPDSPLSAPPRAGRCCGDRSHRRLRRLGARMKCAVLTLPNCPLETVEVVGAPVGGGCMADMGAKRVEKRCACCFLDVLPLWSDSSTMYLDVAFY
jgi:hypothetical protein